MDRNEAILQTTPEAKYMFAVNEIIADKDSRGYNDIYKECNKTSYDIIAAKIQNTLNMLNECIKENRKVMDKIIKSIENSKKKPEETGYKKASAKEVDEWQKIILKLQEEFVSHKSSIDLMKPVLDDILFNQFVELGQRQTMRHLRNKYLRDHDKEYLTKGVTWAFNYAAKHRLNIDMTQYAAYYK